MGDKGASERRSGIGEDERQRVMAFSLSNAKEKNHLGEA